MKEGVEIMGQNLTCYMNIKVLLIIVASAILAKIGLTELVGLLGLQGNQFMTYVFMIIDNSVPIYFVVSIIIDMYNIGRLKIPCLLFDLLIAFLTHMGYWVGIVIVAYIFEMLIGFFKYLVF